jgi:hypothetical protein
MPCVVLVSCLVSRAPPSDEREESVEEPVIGTPSMWKGASIMTLWRSVAAIVFRRCEE